MRKIVRNLSALLGLTAAVAIMTPAAADGLPQDPLARFEQPVCPGVIGLKVDAAEQMVARVKSNAESFGLKIANAETCDPNLIIAFLADGRDYLQRLADDRPYLFRDLPAADRRALLSQEGPVRAWVNTQVRTRDGIFVGRAENLTQPPSAGMWSAHSRMYRPVREDISSSMILFDRDAIGGLGIDQLADYATLRGLARTFPEEAGEERASILSLFDARQSAPVGLTAFDRSFLRNLYDGIPNLPASARLNGLPDDPGRVEE